MVELLAVSSSLSGDVKGMRMASTEENSPKTHRRVMPVVGPCPGVGDWLGLGVRVAAALGVRVASGPPSFAWKTVSFHTGRVLSQGLHVSLSHQ